MSSNFHKNDLHFLKKSYFVPEKKVAARVQDLKSPYFTVKPFMEGNV